MKQLWIGIYMVLFAASTQAQGISFSAEADTNAILIGEQITVQLRAELDASVSYSWPAFPDSVEGIDLVEASPLDTVEQEGRWILEQQLTLTSFDSGYFAVPPLMLTANGQTASTDAIGLAVRFPDTSQQEGFYDIKKPLEVPFNWLLVALIIWGVLVATLIGIWLWLKYRKRKKTEHLAPEMQIPPPKYALMQLAELEKEELWQKGELKAYYSRLIDILRLYLERQLNMHAMESTAEEIIEDLEDKNLPKELFEEIKQTLRLSAMVKFAKEKPGPGENEAALNRVRHFVEHTRPKPETQKEKAHVE